MSKVDRPASLVGRDIRVEITGGHIIEGRCTGYDRQPTRRHPRGHYLLFENLVKPVIVNCETVVEIEEKQ